MNDRSPSNKYLNAISPTLALVSFDKNMSIPDLIRKFCQESDHDSLSVSIFTVGLAYSQISDRLKSKRYKYWTRGEGRFGYLLIKRATQWSSLERGLNCAMESAKEVEKAVKLSKHFKETVTNYSKRMEKFENYMKRLGTESYRYPQSEIISLSNFIRLILEDNKKVEELIAEMEPLFKEYENQFRLLEPILLQFASEDVKEPTELLREIEKLYNALAPKMKTTKILTERIEIFYENAMGHKVAMLMEQELGKNENHDSIDSLAAIVEKPKKRTE